MANKSLPVPTAPLSIGPIAACGLILGSIGNAAIAANVITNAVRIAATGIEARTQHIVDKDAKAMLKELEAS